MTADLAGTLIVVIAFGFISLIFVLAGIRDAIREATKAREDRNAGKDRER